MRTTQILTEPLFWITLKKCAVKTQAKTSIQVRGGQRITGCPQNIYCSRQLSCVDKCVSKHHTVQLQYDLVWVCDLISNMRSEEKERIIKERAWKCAFTMNVLTLSHLSSRAMLLCNSKSSFLEIPKHTHTQPGEHGKQLGVVNSFPYETTTSEIIVTFDFDFDLWWWPDQSTGNRNYGREKYLCDSLHDLFFILVAT